MSFNLYITVAAIKERYLLEWEALDARPDTLPNPTDEHYVCDELRDEWDEQARVAKSTRDALKSTPIPLDHRAVEGD